MEHKKIQENTLLHATQSLSQTKEPSLWVRGKKEHQRFLNIQLKKGTSFKTFLFGMLIAITLAIPFGILLYQYVDIYKWNPKSFILFLSLSFVFILFLNGLSNLYTVKLAKAYASDMLNLQEVDEMAIMFYQILNPGFSIFLLILFILFGARII